jgi:hypothetical protein
MTEGINPKIGSEIPGKANGGKDSARKEWKT